MITVVISTWCTPYDQTVQIIKKFKSAAVALHFINKSAQQWWEENDGDRSVAEGYTEEPWQPCEELGYDWARWELWGGEQGFHAMLDAASYAELHEAHYKREYDDKGLARPGYLINSYVDGHKPGGMTTTEAEKYEVDQAIGLEQLEEYRKAKED